jgi:hypothetical protein
MFFPITDPGSDFFPSRIPDPIFSIPDPGNMIWVVHPGYQIQILTFTHPESRIPDPGIKKALDPGSGSATLVAGINRKRPALFFSRLIRL